MGYTPKWIDDIQTILWRDSEDGIDWDEVKENLLRINTLLCIAASETDNEFLYDDIKKEIKNVEVSS